MKNIARAFAIAIPVWVALCGCAEDCAWGQSGRPSLLIVSIDGMRPDYVTHAVEHGLKIPHLKALMNSGAYASGVHGVLPTVTYPSHTTLLTGVWPARHGIYSNLTFDPLYKNLSGWYWYSEDIRVPTLWQAAADAGLVSGSVSWPVSVGARFVRYLIPEYWRSTMPDDLKLLSALSTPGLFAHLQRELGPYITDLNQAIAGDRQRTRYAEAILRENGPDLMTVHLAAVDHLEHQNGPFSKEANAALEELDGFVGSLEDAMRSRHSDAAICILSDHGFTRIDHHLHLMQAFVDAGLISIDPKTADYPQPKVLTWTAEPWIADGSAAIVLKDGHDVGAREKVKDLLSRLAHNPANGINAILDQAAISAHGGSPEAAFWVDMKSNFAIDHALRKPLVESTAVGGVHGYSPDNPELLASFFIAGQGIRHALNLGQIDMRSIAPTLARYLGVKLEKAELPPLSLGDKQ